MLFPPLSITLFTILLVVSITSGFYINHLEKQLKAQGTTSVTTVTVVEHDTLEVIKEIPVTQIVYVRDTILVIGQESWLHDNAVDLGKFEDNGVILAAPNFCSPNSPTFLQFNAAYINKHGVIPSDSAIKGYEMMMNIGRAMQVYGTHFQDGLLNGGTFPGVLTAGYLLQPTRDNGLVPFVKFREGQLVPIK